MSLFFFSFIITTTTMLRSEIWKNNKMFQNIINTKETQAQYYKRMNASTEVLQLVELESKRFGTVCEKLIIDIFGLGERTSSQNDATYKDKKIEIKCARYWAGKDDCKWQHLEPEHDYDYALFGLLGFDEFKIWAIKKSVLMGELRDKKIVTYQGKQGWWTNKTAILPYLTPINSVEDLDTFIL